MLISVIRGRKKGGDKMKVLITGANGVVGKAMTQYLKSVNVEVVEWDRKKVSPFAYSEMKEFIQTVNPDILFHFAIASESTGVSNESWKINYEWTSELAWITKELGIKFLFTSTAMVFSDNAKGPFTINSIPDAVQGYGYEKLKAEERAKYQNENSYIARLGWQIGEEFDGNNMLAYFDNENKKNGFISASKMWYPACSFVADTVAELYRIVSEEKPGLYMIDSNDRYSFFEIASIINSINGEKWKVMENNSFVFEQRMVDYNTKIRKLSTVFDMYRGYKSGNYKNGNQFHTDDKRIYTGEDNSFKLSKYMEKVVYEPAHFNKDYSDARRGMGKTFVKWIYSEQEGTRENFVTSNLTVLHKTYLEPNGSIGEHTHTEDDEIYYIFEGMLKVNLTDKFGKEKSAVLKKGDAHAIRKGERHFIETNNLGAKFMVIGIR